MQSAISNRQSLKPRGFQVVRNFRITAADGKNYETNHYDLDVIISVGYCVKSAQGTQFCIWATKRLKEYIIKGFALNDNRFKSGTSMNYFNDCKNVFGKYGYLNGSSIRK